MTSRSPPGGQSSLFGEDGRYLLLAIVAAYYVVLAASGHFMHYADFWKYLGVPAQRSLFGDLHHITNGWDCVRQGYDIRINNSCNGDAMTYPGLWIKLRVFGFGSGATVPLGILFVAWFYFSIYMILPALSKKESLIYAAMITSPSAMLAVERGNIDMVMFSLAALAVWVLARGARGSAWISGAAILLAAFLKLYPIAAVYAVLHQGGRYRPWVVFAAVCVAFVVFLGLTLDDIRTVHGIVPEPPNWAYGAKTIGRQLSNTLAQLVGYESWTRTGTGAISMAAILSGVAIAWVLARRFRRFSLAKDTGTAFLGFQAGASVYVFTWLIASNFDYRLIFLILALPQVLLWLKDGEFSPRMHRAAVVAMIGSTWLGFFLLGVFHSAINVFVNLSIDQFLEWYLFLYLTCMLLVTAPPWLRSCVGLKARD